MCEVLSLLAQELDAALALLGAEGDEGGEGVPVEDLRGWLEESLAALDTLPAPTAEPIRIIHHLSCTGGTLFAKCIAAMPNVLLLNEVDPLSPLPFRRTGKPPFTPTDMIALLRQGDPHISQDLLVRLFVREIGFLRDELARSGRVLVLREHSHSHFLTGDEVPDRPTLREMLVEHYPVHSLVTVRNLEDSYSSMKKYGWHEMFSPSDFDEYCRRHAVFLARHEGIDIVRYEDFVAEPGVVMRRICDVLALEFSDKFEELFSAFRFSGDSGRGGDRIKVRGRR